MSNRPDKIYFETPFGEAVFPWLTKADIAYDATGVYHTQLALEGDEANAFIAFLSDEVTKLAGTLTGKQAQFAANPVYEEEYDDEAGVPTGRILIRAKLRANVPAGATYDAFSQSPVVVDMDTNTITQPVYSGSVIRLKGEVRPYVMNSTRNYGVSLRMAGVQVKDLVTGGVAKDGWGEEGGTIPGQSR